MSSSLLTVADALVERLAAHDVSVVFGYPGGQLTPLYDALSRRRAMRHVLARDEQAATFMADGFARATGRPGVCLAVCGPGVFNAFAALATAFTDSVPILLISGQMATPGLGLRSGYYHENEQLRAVHSLVKRAARITRAEQVRETIDEAFLAMTSGRPGPAFVEIPLDVQKQAISTSVPLAVPRSPPLALPDAADIERLAERIEGWQKPLLLAGGGVEAAGAAPELGQLATRLGAPVFTSFLGKTALSSDHPLKAGLPWRRATSDLTDMAEQHSPLFAEADGILALGCRFTQALTGSWSLRLPSDLVQVDIDPQEIGRHYPVAHGIVADARLTLERLLQALPPRNRVPWAQLPPPAEPWRLPRVDLLGPLRRRLPRDGIVVADITRLSYIMLADFPTYEPRTFLHPAGFVAMGYGIPAALGAKTAFPKRTVVAVVGDGCFLMSAMELATAVQENLPIVVILVNDNCLTLIKAIQERRYESRFLGVDLHNPDWQRFAQAFGIASWQVDNDADFDEALSQAIAANGPALIEVKLGSGIE